MRSQRLRFSAGPNTSKSVDVSKVLIAAGSGLILNERVKSDHPDKPAVQVKLFTVGNSFIERDAGGAVKNIDPARRKTDLKDAFIGGKIGLPDFESFQRRSERRKGLIDTGGVTNSRTDQNVEMLRGAGVSVKGNGVSFHNDKLGAGVVKLN